MCSWEGDGRGLTEGTGEERCRGGVRGTARRRACATRAGVGVKVDGPAGVRLWGGGVFFFIVIARVRVNWHE